jgi:hypothetical protein
MRDSGMSRWRVSSLVLKSVSSWRVFGRSIGIRPRADVNADASDQPLDVRCRDLRLGEPHDVPSGQERLQIFLGVGDETGGAIVPADAFDEDAALDLDEHSALNVREVRAPFALSVKSKLAIQRRAAERLPKEGELRFETRGWLLVTEAEAHAALRMSKRAHFG